MYSLRRLRLPLLVLLDSSQLRCAAVAGSRLAIPRCAGLPGGRVASSVRSGAERAGGTCPIRKSLRLRHRERKRGRFDRNGAAEKTPERFHLYRKLRLCCMLLREMNSDPEGYWCNKPRGECRHPPSPDRNQTADT